MELLYAMPELRAVPDVISFSAAISACEKGLQWSWALFLLSDMIRHGIDPNIITMNAAARQAMD